jgi:hypothetical protein
MDADRPLTGPEQQAVQAARNKAFVLYEGRLTPHRSCGICLAETFGLPTRSYQALRRGGLTGLGTCGSVVAGRLVLGEILGDPDPTGAPTDVLRGAIAFYDARVHDRIGQPRDHALVCNDLTAPYGDFKGPARAGFCTMLATEVATLVAETLIRSGVPLAITPVPGAESAVAPPRPG